MIDLLDEEERAGLTIIASLFALAGLIASGKVIEFHTPLSLEDAFGKALEFGDAFLSHLDNERVK